MTLTLIVEDGTNVAGANSYASIADGDAYHAKNVYGDDWNNSDAASKSTALAMATRVIDSDCRFNGYQSNLNQALQWPRTRARNGDAFAGYIPLRFIPQFSNYYLENQIPQILKDATAQVALDLIQADRTKDADTKGIKSIGVGQSAVAITFDSSDRVTPLSGAARRMLAKLCCGFRYGKGSVRTVRR